MCNKSRWRRNIGESFLFLISGATTLSYELSDIGFICSTIVICCPSWFMQLQYWVTILISLSHIIQISNTFGLSSEMPTSELPTGRQFWGRQCLLGMVKLNHHQKCLSQLYYYIQMWMSGSSNMWWGGSRKLFSTASYQPAVAICLLLKSLRLDQPLPSNLLKTVFPMQLTIHKCQRKQHWVTFKSVTEFGRWYNDLDIYVLFMQTMYSHPIIAQGP